MKETILLLTGRIVSDNDNTNEPRRIVVNSPTVRGSLELHGAFEDAEDGQYVKVTIGLATPQK